jgi:4-amino-4-deoxy-L-arabinose transferase-like glycosyltransferase
MPYLQEMIHRLEVGPWFRYLRITAVCLGILLLAVGYNSRSFRNFSTQEAMDAAQVARNLSEGKGYTTLYIRPISVHLVKERNEARQLPVTPGQSPDHARLKEMHPDLANAPGYPVVLAGLMKVLPFRYTHDSSSRLWNSEGRFARYQPDFLIALFNQLLFLGVIVMTFLVARRLFDPGVAWLSAGLLLGCELLWRFSMSGLSTMLLLLIFMGMVWFLVALEEEAREPKHGAARLFLLAGAVGVLVGLGTLTRYSFGWILLPVSVFILLFGGARRGALCLVPLLALVLMMVPWLYRNWSVSGLPFGTATYAILEGTFLFPENRLVRSLDPDFSVVYLRPFIHKLLGNFREIIRNDLPTMGGTWVTAFFLVGLLLGFRNPAIRRLRYFLVSALGLFVVVQALGRTQLSVDSPEINSENLLVLLVPLVLVYGVSLFFSLLDQISFTPINLRSAVVGLFGFIVCLPMLFTFLPPKTSPVVYPPYFPPRIQQVGSWMREQELMMSDIPWAVAWYGQRQCIWLTHNAQSEFFAVNDYLKPIRALYLTPQTMDNRFLSQWVRPGEHSWGSFILSSMVRREIPAGFPLRKAPSGFLPEQLFLSDWDRWKAPPEPIPTTE